MNWLKFSFVAAITSASFANAGTVSGTVTTAEELKTESAVVVWIEGIEDPKIPETEASMSQIGAQFSPAFMVVVAGQSVDMPNDDDIAHNVFSYSKPKNFNLGIYPKGQSKSVKFDQPGVVDVFCSMHKSMKAKILVVGSPFYNSSKMGKEFEIKDIPAGDYELKVWHKDLTLKSVPIQITEDDVSAVEITLTKE